MDENETLEHMATLLKIQAGTQSFDNPLKVG
jgi:hypothetical protein